MKKFLFAVLNTIVVKLCQLLAVTDHGKRVMLVGSIYEALQKHGLYQHITIEELNERLGLADIVSAYTLPRLLCDALWSQEFLEATVAKLNSSELTGTISRDALNRLGGEFADTAPKVIRYDRREMIKEVADLFDALTAPVPA